MCGSSRAPGKTSRAPTPRSGPRSQRRPARRMLLDGEVVAYDGEQTSFGRLQQRLGVAKPSPQLVGSYPVVYCVFDLLELDGEDLTARSLLQRRARLTKAIRSSDALQLIEALRGDSERRFAEACRSGWEGLIAKRADAPYTRGRSKDWLKLKCAWEQEFVIGGFTEPAGSRTDFGALLVGYHEDGQLRYAGKVGTGYSAATLRDLGARLRALETPESPFARRATDPARHTLDPPGAGRPDWLRGVDNRRSPAPGALPRPARRQGPGRGSPRARVVSTAAGKPRARQAQLGADRWARRPGRAAHGGPANGGARRQ